MAKDSRTRAQQNRKIRQEALREQLAAQGHLQHVVDIAQKLSDVEIELEALEVQRLKAAADIKLKLINKYIPDLKAIEVTNDHGEITIDNLDYEDLARKLVFIFDKGLREKEKTCH